VMAYDESEVRIIVDKLEELRLYVKQNENEEVRRRKYVREALRGLDVWPSLDSIN
jgi:DNA-binding MarR family transcriptional regulator